LRLVVQIPMVNLLIMIKLPKPSNFMNLTIVVILRKMLVWRILLRR